jgi:hypothetical protein
MIHIFKIGELIVQKNHIYHTKRKILLILINIKLNQPNYNQTL